MVSRRFFILGASASIIAAPAIVKASSLMRIVSPRHLSADEMAARLVAAMNAWDESPEGQAQLIWDANPGTQYCRFGSPNRPTMPKEFIGVVQNRIAMGERAERYH